jgi:hypothetical protein
MTPRFSQPLDVAAQAAYAELLEVTRQQDLARSVGNLTGSFNRKRVKEATSWYYQFTDSAGGRTHQVFVGPDNSEVRDLVERAKNQDGRRLEPLAKAAIALGCASATPAHFRIVRRLNEIGFFHAGGLLIGTHAFLAYGNVLGVAWGELARTHDIDFAHAGNDITLALPSTLQIETGSALEKLESGFLPVPGFRPNEKTATFVSRVDKSLRVDFLSPRIGRRSAVFRHEGLGVNLAPLHFLEFLLEDIEQAAIVSPIGTVLANVPDPARYALHKLLVFADRRSRNPVKAQKDLRQAGALIEVLGEFRSADLLALWNDLLARGPSWRSHAREALASLEAMQPELPLLADLRSRLVAFPKPSGTAKAKTKR